MTARLAAAVTTLTLVASLFAAGAAAQEQPPTCNGLPATIVGTDGPDRIEGTPGRDVIAALSGKDVIFGRDGNDVICGGPGNDVIKGGRGNDYIEGNQGNDKLIGNIGRDTLDGGNAKDKLFGGGGPDTMIGGSKRDVIYGENGIDTCELDRLDFFSACEAGDVLGGVGFGTVVFPVANAEGFDIDRLDDFVVAFDQPLDAPPEVGLPIFVHEFAFTSDGSDAGVSVSVFDSNGEIITFFESDESSGIMRQVIADVPGDVFVSGTEYFEWVLVAEHLLEYRPSSTSGGLPEVFRLDPPITGPVDYRLTYDPVTLTFLDIYPGPVGEATLDGAFDEVGAPLTGTAPDGAWVVGVDATDWALDLTPAG